MNQVVRKILKNVFFLLLMEIAVSSCAATSHSKKACDKQNAKSEAEVEKEYHKNVDIHNKNQSKEAQKMMKETEKESKKINKSRKVKLKKC